MRLHVQLAKGASVADKDHTPQQGWYDDPNDPTRLRYWDGSQWTDQFGARGTQAQEADPPSVAAASEIANRPATVRFPRWFWALLIAVTLGILWGAAEQHDQSCYNKTLLQAASGNTSQSNCLLLPWNDPAEGG
jgi:hypothetical protein